MALGSHLFLFFSLASEGIKKAFTDVVLYDSLVKLNIFVEFDSYSCSKSPVRKVGHFIKNTRSLLSGLWAC